MKGVTTSLLRAPMILVIIIVAACAGVSAVTAFSYLTPKAEVFVTAILGMYDQKLPEITIRNGRASIREPEPYVVNLFVRDNIAVIIDTREGKQGEALNYLGNVESGVAITRDALVSKLREQIRVVPLKDVPDVVLNSRTLLQLANGLRPGFVPWIAALVLGYFVLVKSLQVLFLALVAHVVAARLRQTSVTYGQWIKICSFALVPPVCIDLVQYLADVYIPGSLIAYFALYVAFVVLAGNGLRLSHRASQVSSAATASKPIAE